MKKISLFLACSLALVACGDDDRPSDDDPSTTPRDMGPGRDLGPGVDMFTPDRDLGPPVDMGGTTMTMCPAGACDLVTNAGCPAGDGCYFAAMAAGEPPTPLCAPAGTLGDGAACDSANACQEGFICVGDPGTCRRICCGDNDDHCDPTTTGQLCLINIVDAEGMPTGVGACQLPDDCDPIEQTGCMSPEACFPSGEGAFTCAMPGPGTQDDSCEDEGCAAGFLCINGASGAVCAEICDRSVAEPTCDGAGLTCNGLTGYDEIGVCVGS